MTTKNKGARVLIVECLDGEYRIEIPEEAKVTFGPAIPLSKKKDGTYDYDSIKMREYALRVYRNKTDIIAVFTGVRQFREESLFKVSKKVVSEAGKTLWKSDEDGYTVTASAKRSSKFVDVKALNSGNGDFD